MKKLNITNLYHSVSTLSHPIAVFKIDRIYEHTFIIFSDFFPCRYF